MYRLFSDFPQGPPGAGLLVLRVTLATFLLTEGALRVVGEFGPQDSGMGGLAYGLVLVGLALFVMVGFLAPIVHTIVAVVESLAMTLRIHSLGVGALIAPDSAALWIASPVLAVAIAATLALTGPGAYSIDSRLFGRREIVLPPRAE